MRMGRNRMITSVIIVGTALPMKKFSVLIHLDLIVWSQKP